MFRLSLKVYVPFAAQHGFHFNYSLITLVTNSSTLPYGLHDRSPLNAAVTIMSRCDLVACSTHASLYIEQPTTIMRKSYTEMMRGGARETWKT
jgi:hypothetical protein